MAGAAALLVVPVMPAAAGNGLAMRAGMLLEGLARDHEVAVLVVPVFGGAGPVGELAAGLAATIEVLDLPTVVEAMVSRLSDEPGRSRIARLHPVPEPSARVGPSVAATVAARAAGAAVVVVMRLYLAPVLDSLLTGSDHPPVVLDLDDLDWERERRLDHGDEAAAYERMAAEYLGVADAVLTASPRDAAIVRGMGPSQVEVVPNGVRPPAERGPATPEHDLLFVGNLSYAPNAQGAIWLCREVLPLLGGVTAAVVGSAPAPEVLALAENAWVTVAADVPDVTPWYAVSRVATAPLHAGAGTRTKILEAWAHGLPVVATGVGAEGVDVTGAALVGDDAAGFAAACRRLLDDPALAVRMGETGRRRVMTATTSHAAARLAELVASVVRR